MLILSLFAATPAHAQTIPQCIGVPTTPTLVPGDTVGFGFCSSEPIVTGAVITLDGVRQAPVVPVRVALAGADGNAYYETPKTIALAAGTHTARVSVINGGGESPPSDAVSVTVSVPVDDACGILGAERVSAVVTRSFQAGTRSGVLYQLSSKSPVKEIVVLLNGAAVSRLGASGPGDTLTNDGGQWFDTPAKGTYKVEIAATNTAGCAVRAAGLVDLTIR